MKEAFLIMAIIMTIIYGHGLIRVESEIKSGVVRMDGKIFSCSEWLYTKQDILNAKNKKTKK